MFIPVLIVSLLVGFAVSEKGLQFEKYIQKVRTRGLTICVVIKMVGVTVACQASLAAVAKLLCVCKKGAVKETRKQRMKGGWVLLAMSLGIILSEVVGRNGMFWNEKGDLKKVTWYRNFVVHCFLPCFNATWNSLIQFIFVREIRAVFTENCCRSRELMC